MNPSDISSGATMRIAFFFLFTEMSHLLLDGLPQRWYKHADVQFSTLHSLQVKARCFLFTSSNLICLWKYRTETKTAVTPCTFEEPLVSFANATKPTQPTSAHWVCTDGNRSQQVNSSALVCSTACHLD